VREGWPAQLIQRAELLADVTENFVKLEALTQRLESSKGEERLVLLGRPELGILDLFDAVSRIGCPR